MSAVGLKPGPWIGRFLASLEREDEQQSVISAGEHEVSSEQLKRDIVEIQKGQKIVYVTDTVFSPSVMQKLEKLAWNADILISESTFLDEDEALAEKYHHLTARQAAEIAKAAHVRKLLLFHVSSRYFPQIDRAVEEARRVFPRTELTSGFAKNRRHFPKRITRNGR